MSEAASPFAPATAFAALQAGRFAVVEAMARTQLARAPGDAAALTLLGMSLQLQQRSAEAVPPYRRLTELQPGDSAHWNNLANALRESDQLEAAKAAFRHGIELAPRNAGLRVNYGLLCMDATDVVEARRQFLEAVELDPANVTARIFGARSSHDCGDDEVAGILLEPWRSWRALEPGHRLELGWLLIALGQAEEGERVLRDAMRDDPDTHRVRARLVTLLERMNRLDEARAELALLPPAESVVDAELRIEIENAGIALALRDADPAHARAILEPLSAQPGPALRRIGFLFALAKICDRQNDVPAAIASLRDAHAVQMTVIAQIHPALAAPDAQPLYISAVRLQDDEYRRWPQLPAPSMRESPVFVIGFPRSGTTMLEQMLDAHPALKSMDERPYIQGVVERLPVDYPHELHRLDAAQVDRLRADYWDMVAQSVRLAPGQRLVDKNPLNLLRLPMILRLFPQARIVLALRHPCDVILSCYMQNFRTPHFASLCKSVESLAAGYTGAMRAWIHHAGLMRPQVMALRYEDLLEDFAGHARRLGDFLGLDDVAPMLSFDEHARRKGFISTPSYAQVTEAPHTRAIGRWRRYGELFEPVLPTLQPMFEHWGYGA